MIPANRRRNQRNKLQQQRSRNGKQWEEDLCEELNAAPNSWARCWPKAWAGQPFDISAMVQGAALGIECKAVQRGNLPFSALRPNEIENLSRFEDAGGAALIAEVVLVRDCTLAHIGDDLHIAVGMRWKTGVRSDGVVIPYPERAPTHAFGVVI